MNEVVTKLSINKNNNSGGKVTKSLDYDIEIDGKRIQYQFLNKVEIIMEADKNPVIVLTYRKSKSDHLLQEKGESEWDIKTYHLSNMALLSNLFWKI